MQVREDLFLMLINFYLFNFLRQITCGEVTSLWFRTFFQYMNTSSSAGGLSDTVHCCKTISMAFM